MLRRLSPVAMLALAACSPRPPTLGLPQPPAPVAPLRVQPLEAEPAGPLPPGIAPTSYALTLEVVPSRERFAGSVDVHLLLDQPRDALWMHGLGLQVSRAELRVRGQAPRVARWEPGAREGVAAVRWEGAVPAGEATLHLEWTAPFNERLQGLYRVRSGGDAYAFTQFEALDARRAFPCFDEPRFKTPFEVRLRVPAQEQGITNAPQVSSAPASEGLRELRFAPTEPLPTYLLAFAVGPLEVVEAPPIPPNELRPRPLPLRGVAARGRGRFLAHALASAGPLVQSMESYFHRAYPYAKLDLLAVPDFGPGAMENAGAITFRETLLLVRPGAPADQLRAVDGVLAHELAHHWFGDLVTLRWWDDLWLNESFATWMGTRTTEAVFPAHHAALGLVAGAHGAMGVDALSTAVPIRRPIETDADLRGGSSAIVYQKGAAVLGMLERWLGADNFRDALRAYLREHEHGIATATDLLQRLSAAGGSRPVSEVAGDFLTRPGVPLLEMDLRCEGNERAVTVTQRRFVLPAGAPAREGRWVVPVCVRFPEGGYAGAALREVCGVVGPEAGSLSLGAGACPTWFVPNAEAQGYYRWSIPARLRAALVEQGWARLSAAERLSLVSNTRAGFTAGLLDASAALPVLRRAAQDPERAVAVEPLPFWTRAIEEELSPAAAERARREVRALYAPAWRALGWTPRPEEDPERALLRRDLAGWLALTLADTEAQTQGARLGEQWLANPAGAPLPLELLGAAVGSFVRRGGAPAVERVRTFVLGSDDALLRGRLLSALGQSAEPVLTQSVLPLALDPQLRVNEVFASLDASLARGEARGAALEWLRGHGAVFERLSPDGRAGTPWMAARFCRAEDQERVRSVYGPVLATISGSEPQLRGALELIGVCAAERSAQSAGLEAAFGRR